MDKLISLQAAIDGFYEMASDMEHLCTVSDYVSFLESLPSAEPEIIRCKDCKHSFLHDNGEKISRICGRTKMCGTTKDDWFCADAERSTE